MPKSSLIKFKDTFKLSSLSKLLFSIRNETLNGKGFILFKGFPVDKWGLHKSAVAYMGLGTYLGYFVSQNGRGHVLGHVKDVGDDPTQVSYVPSVKGKADHRNELMLKRN